jgi:type III secretion protein Q
VRQVRLAPLRALTRAHLALQRRPAAAAEARAALLALSEHLSRELGAPVVLEAHLCDAALQPAAHLARQGAFAVLELAGDALGVLELDPVALGALLQRAAGSAPAPATPAALTRIEEAALGWLVLSALSALRRLPGLQARWSPRLLALLQDPRAVLAHVDARRRHLAVQVVLRLGEDVGVARLLVPAGWFLAGLAGHPEARPGPLAPEVAAAALTFGPRLGPATLGLAELQGLERGDVLLVPGLGGAGGGLAGPGRLLGTSLEIHGTFGPRGLTVTRALERLPQEPTVPTSDPHVPIEVEVELARLRIPLGELGTLQPGWVVPLHLDAAQTVLLRVGDRAVARAELVEVEGAIGARILELLARSP